MNQDKVILHLCADIGSDSQPYKDAGYNVLCIGKNIGVENWHGNQKVYGIIANPVCTEFSIAQGRHKQKDYQKGMFLVEECKRIISECPNLVFWAIENPASGKLKEFLGLPRMEYEPWEYGSPWTKKTALWGKFNVPYRLYNKWEDVPKNENLYVRPGRPKPSIAFNHVGHKKFIPEFDLFECRNDMDFRSLCPQGFAKAFFLANQ